MKIIWNSNFNIQKLHFIDTQPHRFIYVLFVAACRPQWQNWVFMSDTICPEKNLLTPNIGYFAYQNFDTKNTYMILKHFRKIIQKKEW